MDKDLRTILGEQVRGKFNVRYCGGGSLKRCAKLLWGALNQAGNAARQAAGLQPEQLAFERHRGARSSSFPGLLRYTMRYTNRPTGIQQVLSFSGHAPQDTGR